MARALSADQFQAWLVHERGLAEPTADVYTRMVVFGLDHGDIVLAVRKARTRGSLKVAVAAVRLWGEWTDDPKLAAKVVRIARKREVGTDVRRVMDEERDVLASFLPRLEEPYQSTMTIVVLSGLRLGTILSLSRTQIDVGCEEHVALIGPQGDVTGFWQPAPEVRDAFCILAQYGGWDRIQDLLGRNYEHAYKQVRILLRYLCRKSGCRQVRPSELAAADSPVQADILDQEGCCA